MTNQLTPRVGTVSPVEITLPNGRKYDYTFSAYAAGIIKERTGRDFNELLQANAVYAVGELLAPGLDPEELTPKQIGKMINLTDIPYLLQQLRTAIERSFPNAQSGETTETASQPA